mgnify:CR=1 FL=1|tara:strand:- start:1487 stop:1732 length:246 start_codon:yes stop_codon:yes gene_type:complete
MNSNTLALFFYAQCAGSTPGHISFVPNNPVLYSLILAASGGGTTQYAATIPQFANMLREIAEELDIVQMPPFGELTEDAFE